jgi:hypothetical protein
MWVLFLSLYHRAKQISQIRGAVYIKKHHISNTITYYDKNAKYFRSSSILISPTLDIEAKPGRPLSEHAWETSSGSDLREVSPSDLTTRAFHLQRIPVRIFVVHDFVRAVRKEDSFLVR